MVRGLVVFNWNQKSSPEIKLKHPNNFEISDDLINKIHLTISNNDTIKEEDVVKTTTNEFTIFSYSNREQVSDFGYEIVSMILEEKEKIDINKLKEDFITFSQELFKIEKHDMKDYFYKNVDLFFGENSARKILLIGRAGTGKTSIKKIIFEGKDPKDLLLNPLEPTRGISPNVYSWLDLKLGIFDSSGQELSFLLENEEDSDFNLAFENTDVIVYVMDYTLWNTRRNITDNDLQRISQIINSRDFPAKLIIFFHKVDLIERQEYDIKIEEIKEEIQNTYNFDFYFTSIHPEWIYNLYNAFHNILSSSSQENSNLMSLLENQVRETSKTMAFITNLQDSIIVQSMTQDFNTSIINHSHKLVAEINQNFEEMSHEGRIDHLILSSEDNFNIILNNLNMSKFGLKYLIVLSESLSANKLILLIGQVRLKIKNYYYLEK